MRTISPDMQRAALIRQDSAAQLRVLSRQSNGRTPQMMPQPLSDITLSEADRSEIAPIVANCYLEALILLEQAEKLRKAASLPVPAVGLKLYGALLPRQSAAVTR